MIIGLLTLRLRISYAQSLKDKRRVIKSLLTKTKNKFNVSISEISDLDSWHYATIGAAFVTNDTTHAHQMLNQLEGYLVSNPDFEIIKVEKELL